MALSQRALCTLADLKTELGISGGTEDTRLERLIEVATRAIEKYCGVDSFHYEEARVDDIPGHGTPILQTPKTPIIEIDSIVWDPDDANETITATLYSVDNEEQGRIYREGGWRWTAAVSEFLVSTFMPGTEQSLYRVTYDCGWVTQNQEDLDNSLTRNLPHDLEDACLQIAAMRYKWSPHDPSVKSEKLQSWAVSYGGNGSNSGVVPAELAGILDGYKRIVFA